MPKSEAIATRARRCLGVAIVAAPLAGRFRYRFLQRPVPAPRGALAAASRPRPVASTLTFVTLATGHSHTCGLASGGDAYCWGYNSDGEPGVGGTTAPTA